MTWNFFRVIFIHQRRSTDRRRWQWQIIIIRRNTIMNEEIGDEFLGNVTKWQLTFVLPSLE